MTPLQPDTAAPVPPAAPGGRLRTGRTSRAGDISLIAVFAALLAALAIMPPIPIGPAGVPITLQTFAVALCGLVLGPWRGAAAVLLYVVLGLLGLPILTGLTGGIGVLAGPSAGYLLSFTLYALAAGFVARWALRRLRGARLAVALFVGALGSSLLINHPLGILGMSINADLPLGVAALADLAYWPGDIIKTVLAVSVALIIHRAFPEILRRRGAQAPGASAPGAPTSGAATASGTGGTRR
ncbi:biotin transport system substrate-specific component [Brevibacterium sanguinis]|uniref:Biotin transport system substrate-specific component n=2 Tax=Brevibacterium TaxID=1696 RepID=A0A366IMT7_9MICO|nr:MULTISPECIES: biotin transporter BioY [Brevibacterium]RBP68195.1 biotin transport system substrate-specific component [Brevibacterium sanguinis]RBP74388.1 biotin transport system substrate-specific component [Brevibacterium celere]